MANEDLNKEINKQIKETARDIEKARSELKPSFKNLIDEIKQINPELAKNTAEIKKSGKDSFAAALQANKFAKQTRMLVQSQKEGLDSLDPKDFEKLKETFAEFGDAEFDFESYAGLIGEQNRRVKNLKRATTQLSNEEKELKALQTALKDKEEEQAKTLAGLSDENREHSLQVYADMNAGLVEEIKQQEKVVARKKEIFDKDEAAYIKQKEQGDELSERQNEVFKKLNESTGRFGQFSEGVNDLIGIDIGGFADDIVKKVNAFGKIFGAEDLFGTIFSSIQGALTPISDAIGETIVTPLKDAIVGVLGGAIGAVVTGSGLFAGAMTKAGLALKGGAIALLGSMKKFLLGLGLMIKQLFLAGVRMLAALPALISSALMFVGGLLATAASMFAAALPFIGIGLLIVAAIVGLIMAFMYMYENVEWFREGIDYLADKFWEVYQFLADAGVFETIKQYFTDIKDALFGIFGGVVDFINAAMEGDFSGMFDAIKDIWSSLKDLFLAPFKYVKNLIMGQDPEGLEEAQESGLYDLDRIGNSEINKDKVKGAPMGQLKAIVAHDDLNEEDMALIKEEIARQEAINLSVEGAAASSGQDIADGTTAVAAAGAGGGQVTVINQVNDNSNNSNATNLVTTGKTNNSDSTAGRVANNVEQ